MARGGSGADGVSHLLTNVWVVALGAGGSPPGPTLAVLGRPVAFAYTVTPGAGTGTEDAEGNTVPGVLSDGASVVGPDTLAFDMMDATDASAAPDDGESTAVVVGFGSSASVLGSAEATMVI